MLNGVKVKILSEPFEKALSHPRGEPSFKKRWFGAKTAHKGEFTVITGR